MNILNKAALQSLKKSRARTAVTIVGVILSAALITAVLTFGVSLLNYMADGAAHKYGGWHVAFLDVDSSFAQEQAHNQAVAHTAAFQNMGCAALPGGTDPNRPYLFLDGFYKDTFRSLPITLLSGRLPENSGEVVVSGSVSTKGGVPLKTGDKLTLAVGSRMNGNEKLRQNAPYHSEKETLLPTSNRTYTVVGICQTPDFQPDSAPGFPLITTADPESEAPDLSLFVTLKNPRQVQAYAKNAVEHTDYPYLLHNNVLRFLGLSDDLGDRIFNTLLYSVGGIVAIIIMIGSIFLIYNSFSISLSQRTHQFGILASVGATAKQLRHSVLFEGLCIGAIGIPLGVIVGLGGIGLVIAAVARNFKNILYDNVPLTLAISLPAIAAAAAVSLVTILISAWLPARKAAGMPVMDCIRQTNEVKVESNAIKTSKWTQRIYGLEGTLALKNFKRNKKRYRSIVLSLVLSIVLFISTSAFVTDLKQTLDQTASVTSYDIGLAVPDLDDNEMVQLYGELKTADGIYESSYQALMKASCTVKKQDLSAAYLRHETSQPSAAPQESGQSQLPEAPQLSGQSQLPEAPQLSDQSQPSAAPQLSDQSQPSTAPQESGQSQLSAETVNLPVDIQFLDDDTYETIIKGLGLPAADDFGQDGNVIAVAKMQDSIKQANTVDQMQDVFAVSSLNAAISAESNHSDQAAPEKTPVSQTGETLPSKQRQNVNITLVNLTPPDTLPIVESSQKTSAFFRVLAPYSLKERFETMGAHTAMKGLTFRSKTPSLSADQMKATLQSAGITQGYTLYNMDQLMDQSRNYIFIANVFSYGFIIMISLIAAANVFNTISTNIKLRRRELAMLRSVGMSHRDFNRMMRFECAFYGMRALLFGLPVAILSSWLIYKGMVMGGADGIRFTLPWLNIGISVFSVLLVILITMMYAVRKIKKENIIDALRDDMA